MASTHLDVATLTEREKHLQSEYESGFSPSCYLAEYTGIENVFSKFTFNSLHRVFSNDYAKGNTLLEVGCGPTIHSLISASHHFKHIVTSDFLEVNRATVQKWLKNEPGAHDWSDVFKHIAALEKEEDYHMLEERVRKSVEDVIHCDVLQSNPIAPVDKQFDAIVTCYCLESATADLVSYKKAIGNVANLLKPGGTLVIVGEMHGSFYCVGTKRFPAPVITKDVVHDALSAANLNVIYWSEEPLLEKVDKPTHDCTDVFVAVSRK